jgi:5-methylcytosine-specific restriction endonuclease McrA
MTRRSISTRRRVAIFERDKGRCHICGESIDGARDRWDVEHIVPLALGGDDDGDNLAPAHARCHAGKTKQDAGQIAKAKRVHAKHTGAKAPSRKPLPGSRASRWKRKVTGQTIRRD